MLPSSYYFLYALGLYGPKVASKVDEIKNTWKEFWERQNFFIRWLFNMTSFKEVLIRLAVVSVVFLVIYAIFREVLRKVIN